MTLQEIAEQHGWTFHAFGRTYEFRKGDLNVVFSRQGHGRLDVKWYGYRAPWDPHVGELRIYNSTREEFVAALLPTVTDIAAKRRVEASLRKDVESRRASLLKSQESLDGFLTLVGGV
jgi:hypothetical protein